MNYEVITDEKGRLNAVDVQYVTRTKDKPLTIGKSIYPVYLALLFLAFMSIAVLLKIFPSFILAAYVIASLITIALYWFDKRAAENNAQRIPETTLHLFSLMGGWLGGLFAQRVFQHKSTKKSFQSTYWITVFLNIVFLAIIAHPSTFKLISNYLAN